MRLAGLTALVTGAGSGIGAAVCRAFHAEGAAVAAVDIDAVAARKTVADLSNGIAVPGDVSASGFAEAAVAATVAEFGQLDVLATIAGIFEGRAPNDTTLPDDAEWRRIITVNLDGTYFFVRAALAAMVPRRSGSVITMSSIAGVAGQPGAPHYSAAKAGILGLTRSLSGQLASTGIRLNAIAPGPVETPMASRWASTDAASYPLHRRATPEEIAAVAVFLASAESSYVSGETISVNGGLLTI